MRPLLITATDFWLSTAICLLAWWRLFPHVLSGLHWHDTSEFIAAGRTLAIAHPPGHPLTLIAIHLSQLLPFFDAAERAHLASSFWGALGVFFAYFGFLALSPDTFTATWRRSLAVLGALSTAALPLVQLQLIRAEVYAPQWALTVLVWSSLFYAHRQGDLRAFLVAALSLGLLSANHTLLTVALGLALLPRLLTFGLTVRVWTLSLSSYLFGLSLYLYVWLRGTTGGVSGWGWVSDLPSLWETISAKVWQTQVQLRSSEVMLGDNVIRFTAFCMNQVGVLVSLALFCSLTLGLLNWAKSSPITKSLSRSRTMKNNRESKTDHIWGPTLALATFCIILTKITYPFSEANPDFSGYMAAAAPSALFLIYRSTMSINHWWSGIILTLIIASGIAHHPDSRPPQSRGAARWGRSITSEIPTGGTLWTSFYATHFVAVGLLITEGWRADLNLVFRGHRKLPWALTRIQSHQRPVSVQAIDSNPSLRLRGSRFELERTIDSTPEFWPQMSWPGTENGFFTLRLLDQAQPPRLVDLKRFTQNELKLADARLSINDESSLVIDEDSAYSWALHHEMITRWIPLRTTSNSLGFSQALLEAHLHQRDAWLKIIAEEKWHSLDLSHSPP